MSEQNNLNVNRRDLLTRIVPACALTCLGCSSLLSKDKSESVHKFDAEMHRKLTYKEHFANRFNDIIQFSKFLKKELGEDKCIALLKKHTSERMLQAGQNMAKRTDDHSLNSFVTMFRNPNRYKNTLTKEIVEDTENAFEIKVTECLWAKSFLDKDAGDIGFTAICYGDYAWPQGFNKNIKMVRDKTLMQGHDCCNHRYVWTG